MKASSVTCAAILIAVVAALSETTQERGYLPEVKQQIADMSVNGSGIRDTARVLKISPTTVIETLKKTSTSKSCKRSSTRPSESSTDPSSAVAGAGPRS